MTKRIEPAPLVGGPMGGQKFRPVTRWPHYLTSAGIPMTAKHGDRIMSGRADDQSCYILQRDPVTGAVSYGYRGPRA